jgi:hypothetical protein
VVLRVFLAKAPRTAKLAKKIVRARSISVILPFLGELGGSWRLGEKK